MYMYVKFYRNSIFCILEIVILLIKLGALYKMWVGLIVSQSPKIWKMKFKKGNLIDFYGNLDLIFCNFMDL